MRFPTRGRGYWKMNVSHLLEDTCLTDFMTEWAKWQTHKIKYYPKDMWWWCRYVKPMIRKFFIQAGTTRRRDKKLEDFYYSAFMPF
jgi:hypothetical protein